MKKLIEAFGTGSTAEEAQKAALAELNAPANADVSKEIVDVQEKKILGLFKGSTVYKARAFYEVEVEEEKKPEIVAEVKPEVKKTEAKKPEAKKPEAKKPAEKKKTEKKKIEEDTEDDENAVVTVDADGIAENYIRSIFKGLGLDEIHITTTKKTESISFSVECGDDYGCVIGRRGETLDAIQYLVRLVVGKENEEFKRVSVNVGNYREKRANTLTDLAKRNADKVLKYGRNVVLEPMNPYERRIIHTAVQSIENVESYSIGSDDSRRVVIKLVDGAKPTHASSNYSRSRRDSRGGQKKASAPSQPRENVQPKSDVSGASLYGKIEKRAKIDE
ncbi:MAG: KH domain-containing protein [Ruminococcaceae bacterium]|nr:KH domain-containing protein [Oscillospiraceae bacterium]